MLLSRHCRNETERNGNIRKNRFDGTANITTKMHKNAISSFELKTVLKVAFVLEMVRNKITKFRMFFSTTKWFGTEFPAFSSFADCFGIKLRSSECVSILQNGSERNSELFIFRGMARNEISRLFSFAKQTEFRRNESKFPSVSWKMATLPPAVLRILILRRRNRYSPPRRFLHGVPSLPPSIVHT